MATDNITLTVSLDTEQLLKDIAALPQVTASAIAKRIAPLVAKELEDAKRRGRG